MTTEGNGRSRGGHVVFQPTARLLRLLGEELISDEVIAVSELAKNAHDADATRCLVRFSGATRPDGVITIEDDGSGMTVEDFLGGWMQPGASLKRQRRQHVTRGGRRVLGEKGVGRFAVDKLARHLELITRPRGKAREIYAQFCWDDYDDDSRLLSEIHNVWQERRPETLRQPGTVLRLSGLRSPWNERMFRRLCTRLTRLVSPLGDLARFRIIVESDEFPDYSGDLRNDFLARAPYHLEAVFDGDQTIDIQLADRKLRESWSGPGSLGCGPLRVRLYGFDLETPSLARIGPNVEVRAWLREWSGVSVYRDGFRVWPYGEPHDDWLGLDQRRVNNPVVRLSNNQVIGFVEITRDANPLLLDQTNREGLFHNVGLEDLRRLVHFLLLQLEGHRQLIRHPQTRTGPTTQSPPVPGPLEALDRLTTSLPPRAKGQVRKIRKDLEEYVSRLTEVYRRGAESYLDLAASGQVLLGVLAELRAAQGKVEEIGLPSFHEFLNKYLAAIHPGRNGHSRRRTVDLDAEVRATADLLDVQARRQGITLKVLSMSTTRLPRAEVRPEDIRRILFLLFDNAVRSLAARKNRLIQIRVWSGEERTGFDFSDNGPGIPEDKGDLIFDPHYTTWPGTTGMGLTMVRDLCRAHGGEACLCARADIRGATIRVEFRRKQTRATRGQRP